jgi:hypothetical protein
MTGLRVPAIPCAVVVAVFALTCAIPSSEAEGAETAPAAGVVSSRADFPLNFMRRFVLAAAAARPPDNDYPTSERADYVIGCMAANGNSREAMLKCSCAIDTIAGLMPYSDYERAETALSLQLGGGVGGRVGLFRDPPQIKAVIEELRRAQAEANLQCR